MRAGRTLTSYFSFVSYPSHLVPLLQIIERRLFLFTSRCYESFFAWYSFLLPSCSARRLFLSRRRRSRAGRLLFGRLRPLFDFLPGTEVVLSYKNRMSFGFLPSRSTSPAGFFGRIPSLCPPPPPFMSRSPPPFPPVSFIGILSARKDYFLPAGGAFLAGCDLFPSMLYRHQY